MVNVILYSVTYYVLFNILGLSCWNVEESGVEITAELNAIVNQNIEGEEGKNGKINQFLFSVLHTYINYLNRFFI